MYSQFWEEGIAMYAKLVLKNVVKSAKDYLIYIITLTICVMLFYAFLSVSSEYYHPNVGTQYDFTLLSSGMRLAICLVTLLLLFLIRYVNYYMLRRRQKEFAVQAVMGMEQSMIGWLFFAETFIMGIFSIVIGILLGMICSQLITAMLLSDYGHSYQFVWSLYPDTVLLTIGVFMCIFLLTGILNTQTIKKTKILDMLTAERHNDIHLNKSRFMPVVVFLYSLLLAWMLFKGIQVKYYYFDVRYPLPVHLMFWGNIIAPALGLVYFIIRFILRKRITFIRAIAIELIFTVLISIFSACIPVLRGKYMLSYDAGVMNQYLFFLVCNMTFLICGIIFLANSVILAWKDSSPGHRYKGTNLFLFGQIISKLATNTKTMILICITLVLSIFLFIAAPVLTEWSLGYLDIRSVYDIQISSRYNDVYNEEDLPDDSYGFVSKYLENKGIKVTDYCTFSLYLPRHSDFQKRSRYDFPIVGISLTDYNAIRNMLGYEEITLHQNEFTTHWQAIATDEERDQFLQTHNQVETDAGTLSLCDDAFHEEPIGETIYNSYTEVIYIFPDEICSQLLGVMRNRYIMTEENLSFRDAQDLVKLFGNEYPENDAKNKGVEYYIRTNTLQVNSLIANNFVLKGTMIYGAIVLMVICLTVLSLQQLLDAAQYRYRFSILRQLGAEEKEVRGLILKQLGIWFGVPVFLSLLISGIIVTGFLQTFSVEISTYVGIGELMTQLAVTISILLLLLFCYFLCTWILFIRSTEQ